MTVRSLVENQNSDLLPAASQSMGCLPAPVGHVVRTGGVRPALDGSDFYSLLSQDPHEPAVQDDAGWGRIFAVERGSVSLSILRRSVLSSPFILVFCLLFLPGCDRPDARPRQPIAFSHAIHAGQYKMNCQYCHGGVRRSAAAGIPSVRLCMGCHQLVAATRPGVAKIREAFETQQPIRWMRINVLPDFVYFNHYPHVAKGISCQKCHGEVQTMAEIWPRVRLDDMAFCVGCHRENNASVDCYICHR